MKPVNWFVIVGLGLALLAGPRAGAQSPLPPSALSPENLAAPRPDPPFDLTGTWQNDLSRPGSWRFVPEEFTLTPEAQAHYDALNGIVSEFLWMNPHSWIELDVRGDDGRDGTWSVELTAPSYLIRAGWRRSTLTPGDAVIIVVNPLRTGEKIGKFVRVTLPDGTELTERAQQ